MLIFLAMNDLLKKQTENGPYHLEIQSTRMTVMDPSSLIHMIFLYVNNRYGIVKNIEKTINLTNCLQCSIACQSIL